MDDMNEKIKNIIFDSIEVKEKMLTDKNLLRTVESVVLEITHSLKDGNRVYFCGNGGSAADAQHLAAELSGRFYIDRETLPAEALSCNMSYVTAIANDYNYNAVYARQISGIGKKGDILVGLSTSGNSRNIVTAFEAAKEKGVITIAFTGKGGGELKTLSNFLIEVPSTDTPRIQESHITLGHIVCQLVEEMYFKK